MDKRLKKKKKPLADFLVLVFLLFYIWKINLFFHVIYKSYCMLHSWIKASHILYFYIFYHVFLRLPLRVIKMFIREKRYLRKPRLRNTSLTYPVLFKGHS